MFDGIIRETPFTERMPNIACSNINGDSFNDDTTFVSTMRALLLPRIGMDEYVNFAYYGKHFSKHSIENNPADAVMRAFIGDASDSSNGISLFTFGRGIARQDDEDTQACLDFIEQHFEDYYPAKRIPKVTDYFKKNFRVLCYIDSDKKQCYVFTSMLDMRLYHHLQIAILIFLPWYFDKEKGLLPLERELLESLRAKKSEKYLEVLAEMARSYDFRSEYTKKSLVGMETRIERKKITRLKQEIDQHEINIESYRQEIANALKKIDEKNVIVMGLECKIGQKEENGESEIMEYFMANKRLYLQNSTDSSFEFTAKDYIMCWNEDIAESIINNFRSVAYNNGDEIRGPFTRDEMKELLEEIFIKRTFKIRTCGTYVFRLNDMYVSAPRDYCYGFEFSDCMPNPHLQRYSCLGSHEQAINEHLRVNDYIGAIEQCVASCRSLNFADVAVMDEFFRIWYGLKHGNRKCIELPDGTVVDPVGAIQYMREQKGEKDVKDN